MGNVRVEDLTATHRKKQVEIRFTIAQFIRSYLTRLLEFE